MEEADLRGGLHCRVRWRAFQPFARRSGSVFPGGTLQLPFLCRRCAGERRPFEWRTPRRAWTGPIFLAVFPLKSQGHARLIGTVPEQTTTQGENLSWNDVSKRVLERLRMEIETRELVLDLPRAPSSRRSFPPGSRVSSRRRGAHPQSGGRARHEHRNRGRGEPGLETRRRAQPACEPLAA